MLTRMYLHPFSGNCTDGTVWWLQMYGRKNLRILYDAISTLCDAIGGALAEVSLLQPTTITPPGHILLSKREGQHRTPTTGLDRQLAPCHYGCL